MVSIIGAGPAGSYVASLLAKKQDVEIFEDHKEIGIPFQCTGITTASLEDFIKLPKEIVLTKIKRVEVYSPNKTKLEFKLKNPNPVVDRIGLDKFLANKAVDNGAKLNLNSRFIKNNKKEITIKTNKIITKKFNYLIGADGPFSAVAKANDLFKERRFMTGYQARIKLNMDPETIEVWLGIGLFAWIVPEDNKIVRIGLVCNHNIQPIPLYQKLLKIKQIKEPKTLDFQPGLIPIYNPNLQTQRDNVFLIGDAATQVKASTLGGIIPGMRAGIKLQEAIETKQNYPKLCKDLNRDLWVNLKIYQIMNKFKENEFNALLHDLTKPKTKEIIETLDRDYISKTGIKLFLSDPRLIKYFFKMI